MQHLDLSRSLWDRFETLCSNMPRCLVHGDFVGKNVRIQNEQTGALSVIDWDIAGWGVPTVDLEFPDAYTYWSVVRHAWPQLRLEDVESMKVIGLILRNLGLIQATSTGLAFEWLDQSKNRLRSYDAALAKALDAYDRCLNRPVV